MCLTKIGPLVGHTSDLKAGSFHWHLPSSALKSLAPEEEGVVVKVMHTLSFRAYVFVAVFKQ
jgi:hypothetical protein